MSARSRPAGLLTATPHLATLYVRFSNRNETYHLVRFFSLGLLCAALGTMWLVWIHRAFAGAAFNELQQHSMTIAMLAGIVSAIAVSHQRSVHVARVERSWLAALPVSRRARCVEALALQLIPVIAILVLISGFCLLTGAVFVVAGLAAGPCVVTWHAVVLGISLGAAVGLAVPLPKPVIPHPGSRYVPHRAMRGRRPVPSIAALGIWPIRRMFAMLRPKALSRAMLLVLLTVPMGTTAAAAMVWIGQLGALMAFALLATSVVYVIRAARHWLRPLPLSSRRLGVTAAILPAMVMVGIGIVMAWLAWVGYS